MKTNMDFFLPKRQLQDNITNISGVFGAAHEKQAVLVYLDAGKTFDNLIIFFIRVLECMSLGDNFIKWA